LTEPFQETIAALQNGLEEVALRSGITLGVCGLVYASVRQNNVELGDESEAV
jgi:hypothetical protein